MSLPDTSTGDSPPGGATSAAAEAHAAWRRGVAAVLAKARRTEVSALPPEPERLLDTATYEGVTVRPLYTGLDESPERPLPGAFPFGRGADAARDTQRGWHVAARFGDGGGDPAAVNEEVLAGLGSGVTALWLAVGDGGVAAGDLARVLDGVLLDLAPLTLDAGAQTGAAADAVLAVLDQRAREGGVADRSAVRVSLGAAPLTATLDADPDPAAVAEAVALARVAAARPERVRAITVDGTAFHNAGADAAQEVGAAAAAGVEYLRALTAGEGALTAAAALGQVEFRLAATDDQFLTIAKLRAARLVWARVAQVSGAPEAGGAPQHAVTSAAMMAQRDPWVNMLRVTLAAFGAGVGGADAVTVLPFDAALPAGAMGVSEGFAQRVARNTQLLLLEESGLGRVLDPGAGSWFVEALTDDLAAAAWAFLQEVERAGGYSAARPLVAQRVAETRAARERDVAHRAVALTGVNEFPNLGEAPLPVDPATGTVPTRLPGAPAHRYGEAFEALRNRSDLHLAAHGARPTAFLAPLGPVAEHNVRATFVANLLAAGGIEAVNPGATALDGLGDAARAAGAGLAVLCGTDARYGQEGPAALAALRAAGVARVYLAGSAKAFPDDDGGGDRPDGYLAARIDAVAALTELLEQVGVK